MAPGQEQGQPREGGGEVQENIRSLRRLERQGEESLKSGMGGGGGGGGFQSGNFNFRNPEDLFAEVFGNMGGGGMGGGGPAGMENIFGSMFGGGGGPSGFGGFGGHPGMQRQRSKQ